MTSTHATPDLELPHGLARIWDGGPTLDSGALAAAPRLRLAAALRDDPRLFAILGALQPAVPAEGPRELVLTDATARVVVDDLGRRGLELSAAATIATDGAARVYVQLRSDAGRASVVGVRVEPTAATRLTHALRAPGRAIQTPRDLPSPARWYDAADGWSHMHLWVPPDAPLVAVTPPRTPCPHCGYVPGAAPRGAEGWSPVAVGQARQAGVTTFVWGQEIALVPTLARLALPGVEAEVVRLAQLLGLDVPIHELGVGVSPIDDTLRSLELALVPKHATLNFGALAFTVLRGELALHDESPGWMLQVAVDGEIAWGGADDRVRFRLSNRPYPYAPPGAWTLTPLAPEVKLTAIADWFGETPSWLRDKLASASLRRLAIAVARDLKSVVLLSGAIHVEDLATFRPSDKLTIRIRQLELGVRAEQPFDASRRVAIDASGSAEFTLTGRAAQTLAVDAEFGPGAHWQVRALWKGEVSLADGIDALGGALGASPVFDEIDVRLADPELSFSDRGGSFATRVIVVQRTGGFASDGATIAVLPGRLEFERRDQSSRFHLYAGLTVRWSDGFAIEALTLNVQYQGGAQADVRVTARGVLTFPPRAPGGATPRLVLEGGYRKAGLKSGFHLTGKVLDLSLRGLAATMFRRELPPGFPEVVIQEISAGFDTLTGAYHFTGTASVESPLRIDARREITRIAFSLALANEAGRAGDPERWKDVPDASGTVVRLAGSATLETRGPGDAIETTSVEAAIHVDARTTRFTVRIDGTELELSRRAPLTVAGVAAPPRLRDVGLHLRRATRGPQLAIAATWTDEATAGLSLTRLAAYTGTRSAWVDSAALTWTFADPPALAGGLTALAVLDLRTLPVRRLLPEYDRLEVALARDGSLRIDRVGGSSKAKSEAGGPRKDLAPPPDGASREVPMELSVGPLSITRLHYRPHLTPPTDLAEPAGHRPGIELGADLGLSLGAFASVAVQRLAVDISLDRMPKPDEVSLDLLTRLKFTPSLGGAAMVVNVPPWLKLGAAVALTTSGDELAVSGVGKVEILERINIGVLVHAVWKQRVLDAGFGFVYATGLALGSPALKITGIAGGFGYNCILELPDRPEAVPAFPIITLMRGTSGAQPAAKNEAEALMASLVSFRTCLRRRERAWCVAFGLTLRIAELVDCAVLTVLEFRNPGFELAIAGVADLPLRLDRSNPKAPALGHIQLALAARFSSTTGTLTVLGALTENSWLLDRGLRLRGGFALCMWFDGPHRGDFLVSIGGYSPLVPRKAHYPALERVGCTWAPRPGIAVAGEMYFALDRYGIQLGCAARLNYETEALTVQAHYSFDAVVQWSPIFFEARLRIGIHVEVRTFITLRLGLDAEMHAWGPPFGAKIAVRISFLFTSLSYTVAVGTDLADARPAASLTDVLTLARGGRPDLLQLAGSRPGAERQAAPAHRGDELQLTVAMAVPATRLFAGPGVTPTTSCQPLDIRPMRVRGARSDLRVEPASAGAAVVPEASAWRLTPELAAPTEALWYFPGDSSDEEKRKLLEPSGRTAITGLKIQPPESDLGARVAVMPTVDLERFALTAANVGPARPAVVTRDVLVAVGFDLEGCV